MDDITAIITMIVTVVIAIVFFIAGLYLYFLPAIIAEKRKIVHQTLVFVLNLLFGWTGIGWIGMLLVALLDEKQKPKE